jgi:hypothetical protein
MNLKNMKKALLASTLGTAMLLGVSIVANAQVYGTYRDYRDYQKQQQKIAREQARQQRRAVERYYRSSNGTYRDQYGNTIVVGQNGYYQDQMGNLYNRNGTVVYSSGNRVVTYPSNSYYNNNRYSNTNGYYNNGYTYGTTGSYRLYNNGSYYTTDYRGMALLRQAVNTGYQQGYQQGQMDRRYGRNTNYYNNNYVSKRQLRLSELC